MHCASPLGRRPRRRSPRRWPGGLTERPASWTDVQRLGAEFRQFEWDVMISVGALFISLASIALGGLAIATAVILLAI